MRFSWILVCTMLSSAPAIGQSLAELAKKEKERRQENTEKGKEVVLDAKGGGGAPVTSEEAKRELDAKEQKEGNDRRTELKAEIEELRAEEKREMYACQAEMHREGYSQVDDDLPACAKMKRLAAKRRELQKELRELEGR